MLVFVKYISGLALILSSAFLSAQTRGIKPVKPEDQLLEGRTRAVVVGISDYQNEDIPDLRFAHKDALLFADYLKDENGGGLDSNDITLLINEQATSGQYISALYGLMEEVEEGDNVILYFSGHGDVESTTISQPGFLLCWDSPTRIYMSGGTFGLIYFQEIISTIADKTKSKVIVITDACRAGKLAGSKIGGAQATAAHLAKQYANEIKILSCQPNEFALESESWGGGRGVFSYYFLRGIQGLADNNEDNIVTLSEISRYLEDMVTPAVDPHSQIPMVVGNRQATISIVNEVALARIKSVEGGQSLSTIDHRSVKLSGKDFSDTMRYYNYLAFLRAMEEGHLLYPMEGSAWEIYQEIQSYGELDTRLGLMKRNLAAALQDDSQQAINKYISSDQDELEKRWNFDNEFWRYPDQLDKATQLLGQDHFYYKPLRARYFYFSGLTKRLEAEKSQDTSLFYQALALQDSSLSYFPDAVHSINEKGYTYYRMKDFNKAIEQFNFVNAFIDNWPLVWTNLSNCYIYTQDYDRATTAAKRALEIDSSFMLGYSCLGSIYQYKDSLDVSIGWYKKAIDLAPELEILYFKLGVVYYMNEEYDNAYLVGTKALSFDTTHLLNITNLAFFCMKVDRSDEADYLFNQAKKFHPDNVIAYQGLIEFYYLSGRYNEAKFEIAECLAKFPKDEISYYYLASIYGKEGNVDLGLENIQLAFENGYNDIQTINEDPNLKNVIAMKEYQFLLEKYKLIK